MILAANLPVVVDLRTVRGYWCKVRRIPAPKKSLWTRFWARCWGQPAPADTVLYVHSLREEVITNESISPEIWVEWAIHLAGEDRRCVVASPLVRCKKKSGCGSTTVSPSALMRNIGRLSEELVSTDELLPGGWFPEPVDQDSKMRPAPDVFESEARKVLRAKLEEMETIFV